MVIWPVIGQMKGASVRIAWHRRLRCIRQASYALSVPSKSGTAPPRRRPSPRAKERCFIAESTL